jgi:hypothetical protein
MNTYRLQITSSITSEPFWVSETAQNASLARAQYWHKHPTHFIVATKEVEQ